MAGVTVKPIREWNEDELWTAFMLIDAIHDFGDPKRSNDTVFSWYISQPIPVILTGTIQTPGDEAGKKSVTIGNYAKGLLGIGNIQMGTHVEDIFQRKIADELPFRIGVPKPPPAVQEDAVKRASFLFEPRGTHYTIKCEDVLSLMKTNQKLLIDVCKTLQSIGLDESTFDRKKLLVNTDTTRQCIQSKENIVLFDNFFKGLLVNNPEGQTDFSANYDASPNISKYILNFNQIYTPLNLLDSATSSKQLHYTLNYQSKSCEVKPATFQNITEPWQYERRLLTLPRGNEETAIATISLIRKGDNQFQINCAVPGIQNLIQSEVLNLSDPRSGPTLPYLAALMKKIHEGGDSVTEDNIRTYLNFPDVKGGGGFYTLQDILEQLIHGGRNTKEFLLRFLCDWKGFGDAEQIRYAATELAKIGAAAGGAGAAAKAVSVRNSREFPKANLLMGTVDRNSWLAMRLSGLTCCYSNQVKAFHYLTIRPNGLVLTAGQKVYATFTQLASRMSAVVTLATKFGDGSTLVDITTNINDILKYIKAENYAKILESFNIKETVRNDYSAINGDAWKQAIQTFLLAVLKNKFQNAAVFFGEVNGMKAKFDAFKDFDIPVIAPDKLDSLLKMNEAGVAGFNVGNPPEPIQTVIERLNDAINASEADAQDAQTLLSKFPTTKLNGKANLISPLTIFQTRTLVGDKLKSNPILGFDTTSYKTLFSMLDVMPLSFTAKNDDSISKALDTFVDAYREIRKGYFVVEQDNQTDISTGRFAEAIKTQWASSHDAYIKNRVTRVVQEGTMKASIGGALVALVTQNGGAQLGGGTFTNVIEAFFRLATTFKVAFTNLKGTETDTNVSYFKVGPPPPPPSAAGPVGAAGVIAKGQEIAQLVARAGKQIDLAMSLAEQAAQRRQTEQADRAGKYIDQATRKVVAAQAALGTGDFNGASDLANEAIGLADKAMEEVPPPTPPAASLATTEPSSEARTLQGSKVSPGLSLGTASDSSQGSTPTKPVGGRRKTPRKRAGRQTYRRKFVD